MADASRDENTVCEQREFVQQIRTALKEKKLVICAGAGVLLFATADASGRIHQKSLTFLRLMRSGFDYVQQHLPSTYNDADNKDQIEKARAALDVPDRQYSEADEDSYLNAAKTLADILKPFPETLADWLRGQFQTLDESPLAHSEIHDALKKLHQAGAQLMTITQDHLIERHCGLTDVFHPHGEWEQPDRVVMNTKEYYAAADNTNPAQDRLRKIFENKTVLFVGCGPGTGDPSFGQMLKWLGSQDVGGGSHYILLRYRDNYREMEGRLPLVKARVETVDDIPRWIEGLLEKD
ncbi:hypothetical protein QBC34DRAFT_404710 [Podospora aff. communis PSN243]|uniref:SIR2-like domain-containing protein n=1 Tax=Podospora aff. communis PSN243 TaxID=3040156 RepID=A0AAV9GP45_9PEZI|nr:hypothetical protein QBC34DRAFT_404710 [Podospora aff. communis PSN243]